MLGGELVANRLRARPDLRLILPTGHTPAGLYEVLRAHAADGSLAADRARLFQLDEYVGLEPADPRSYVSYLRRELAPIRFAGFHTLDGMAEDLDAECGRHQELLDAAPIDLVVLGLGRDGHVAFDEPGSSLASPVRRVRLHETTRADAARDFGGVDRVPHEALTVGLRTLLKAREIVMLVSGPAKAGALRSMLDGEQDPGCPASLLRNHPRLTVICDTAAARLLRAAPGGTSDRAVIVLGHREPGISAEHRISDESRARLQVAVNECRLDPPRVVLFTGWTRTGGLSEAEQMRAEWPLRDIPALLEEGGRSTAENASRSLPIIRAIGDISRVTVVTSRWHLRAPFLFQPFRALGLHLSFRTTPHGDWPRMLRQEVGGMRRVRDDRRRALAEMRLPPEVSLTTHGLPPGQPAVDDQC
jgi:glucosamine-6-phosphate deaminase